MEKKIPEGKNQIKERKGKIGKPTEEHKANSNAKNTKCEKIQLFFARIMAAREQKQQKKDLLR